jgi:7-dehydrocholesterol reductase
MSANVSRAAHSDLSFTTYQYQIHGYLTNSIIVADILHAIYVLDFFINEDWCLRTIDICHDHFGFYLAWGSVVWLPSMYILQTQYLARHPLDDLVDPLLPPR